MERLLFMDHISKSFPGVKALDDVNIDIYPGEVHALVGENGAGKSTLMKILNGVYQPDKGNIFVNGEKQQITSTKIAQQLGISIVFQEFKILIFDEPTRGIDVGAKYEIYKLMNEMSEKKKGIIMISSDLPEILGMCDRVYVFCKGKISGMLTRDEMTQERILRLATGVQNSEEES